MHAPLTAENEATLRWAGEAFRRPWFDLCDRLSWIARGEKHDGSAYRFDPFFLPFPLDARWLHALMRRGATQLLLGANPSLFTVVLSPSGDRILWSAVERAENGVFVEYHVLNDRLDEPWAAELAALLAQDRLADALAVARAFVASQPALRHIEVGVLKAAHLQFFAALERAWQRAGGKPNVASFTRHALEAVRQIVQNRWLRFAPPINLGRLLAGLLPLLQAAAPLLGATERAGGPTEG